MRTSTHIIARELLRRQEGPLRGFTFGRFVLMWDGRPGDYRETVATEDVLGPEPTDDEAPNA